ncbi:alpha/beta hydrolase [Roseomonas sp. SG15]|uniref:Alpha/beta hydrolase n=2 Tax=Roseomonas indoligenes TaxID=2820811 RepID=A0A940N021_9PROT|nr:alpha/beta hydrolase [Pararoseomonas indoligenes]
MPYEPQLAEALVHPGRAEIVFNDPAGDPRRPVTLHAYRPEGWRADGRVVVVLHGAARNGDAYRDFWVEAADRHGLLIVASTFSAKLFPGPAAFNNGGVLSGDGSLRPPEWRGYRIPARIVGALRDAGLCTRGRAFLFGHSAGGQFVQRLVSTEPTGAFEAVIAANPGWFTLPMLDRHFPEGLGGVGVTAAHLARLLAFPMTVLSGEGDIRTDQASLPREPVAMAQGPNRFERAGFYMRAGEAEAARLGLPFAWSRVTVPHIGHDGAAMSRAAASLWFDGHLPPEPVLAEWARTGHGAL